MSKLDLPDSLSPADWWRLNDYVRKYGGARYYKGGFKRWLVRSAASFGVRAWLDLVALTSTHHFRDPFDVVNRAHRGEAFIAAIWHHKLLGAILFARHTFHRQGRDLRTSAMVSESSDGELIARTFRDLRGTTIRGSSSRRADSALRAMVNEAKRGGIVVATPDGPRGPKFELQDGVLIAARLARKPLVPMAAHFGRSLRFASSWDGFEVPLPFGRFDYEYGEPLEVPRSAKGADFEEIRAEFRSRLMELTQRVESPKSKVISLGKEKA